jgi:hypothetical protein
MEFGTGFVSKDRELIYRLQVIKANFLFPTYEV